jgi:hypothetical protein
MKDSLKRIQQQPREVWIVKLADRITNLQPPPKDWDRKRIDEYRPEAKGVSFALNSTSSFLATRLKTKIESY